MKYSDIRQAMQLAAQGFAQAITRQNPEMAGDAKAALEVIELALEKSGTTPDLLSNIKAAADGLIHDDYAGGITDAKTSISSAVFCGMLDSVLYTYGKPHRSDESSGDIRVDGAIDFEARRRERTVLPDNVYADLAAIKRYYLRGFDAMHVADDLLLEGMEPRPVTARDYAYATLQETCPGLSADEYEERIPAFIRTQLQSVLEDLVYEPMKIDPDDGFAADELPLQSFYLIGKAHEVATMRARHRDHGVPQDDELFDERYGREMRDLLKDLLKKDQYICESPQGFLEMSDWLAHNRTLAAPQSATYPAAALAHLPVNPLTKAIRDLLAQMEKMPRSLIDNKGDSFKKAMLDRLRDSINEMMADATKKSDLEPDHPDHFSPGEMEHLNRLAQNFHADMSGAIRGAENMHDMCECLQKVAENALAYDADGEITRHEESLLYPVFTAALEAGIAHLDPDNARLNVVSTKGQRVVSITSRRLHTRHAASLENVLQRYHTDFDRQLEDTAAHEEAVTQLRADTIAPVVFAKRGEVSDDELRQCIQAGLKAVYCDYRDNLNAHDGDEDVKEDMLYRNRSAYDLVSSCLQLDPEKPVMIALLDVIDALIDRDFFSQARDEGAYFHSDWAQHMVGYIAAYVQANQLPENSLRAMHAAKFKPSPRTLGGVADAQVNDPDERTDTRTATLLEELQHVKAFAKAAPEAIATCDRIVKTIHAQPSAITAADAQALHEGVDIEAVDDNSYDRLCERAVEVLQDDLQHRFFDRVNALHLRDGNGPLTFEFMLDDQKKREPFPPHTYRLVDKAYALAAEAVSKQPKGTDIYKKALHKAEDYYLTALAQTPGWSCDYCSDYHDALQSLILARESLNSKGK